VFPSGGKHLQHNRTNFLKRKVPGFVFSAALTEARVK